VITFPFLQLISGKLIKNSVIGFFSFTSGFGIWPNAKGKIQQQPHQSISIHESIFSPFYNEKYFSAAITAKFRSSLSYCSSKKIVFLIETSLFIHLGLKIDHRLQKDCLYYLFCVSGLCNANVWQLMHGLIDKKKRCHFLCLRELFN